MCFLLIEMLMNCMYWFLDEEIDAVRLELKKYGIQLPAFKKIGGILTNDLQGDTAVLHAAIIAINEAIDRKVKYIVHFMITVQQQMMKKIM